MPFLSTPSARRATYHTHHFWIILLYFYPRPPRGGRHALPSLYSTALKFLSTPSARRATFCDGFAQRRSRISIHALREEGDFTANYFFWDFQTISIHALREEGDSYEDYRSQTDSQFLSTPSARRATFGISCILHVFYDFYPRPPRGGRLNGVEQSSKTTVISIHALREEGDL